jgi:hypothetical protein
VTSQGEPEEYWPATEALPLLTELEGLVNETTGQRAFFLYGWHGQRDGLTDAGKLALEKIKARFREIEEALP